MSLEGNGKILAEDMGLCGYPSNFIKANVSPLGETYYFELLNPLQYNKSGLISAVEKLSVRHKTDLTFGTTKEAHYTIFMSYGDRSFLSLNDCLTETRGKTIVVGKDTNGDYVNLDFDKIPHLLIAGTTGSGKSVLLHNLLINFMYYYGDTERKEKRKLHLVLIDPKGSEFKAYKELKFIDFIDNTKSAVEMLQRLTRIMDNRYKLNDPMTDMDIIVIIDELADLMLTSKFECEESIVRLAQKGRACGIHLIVATQRPTIDVCSGLIKANMPYRIALKTASVRDSIVILDHKGAEALKGNGDCIVKLGLKEYHTQIAYPEKELEDYFLNVNKCGK